MTEFYFGNDCTFCQSRIGSTHCLLPYQMVIGYNPPRDKTSKIIDITEIHMRYGLEMLQSNLSAISWIKTRPCSMQSTEYPPPNRSDSNQWSDQMNSLNETVTTEATSVSAAIDNSDLESNYSRYIGDLLNEEELKLLEQARDESDNGVPLDPVTPTVVTTFASVVGSATLCSEPNEINVSAQKLEEILPTQKLEKSYTPQKCNAESSRADRNHLISDLVMMAKAAFNIHACQRDWIKVHLLKESIIYESDIRGKMGAKYNPSRNTSLDGNKALAKEIIATHGSEEIQQWESGEYTLHRSFCLLNCEFASLSTDQSDDSRLYEELIRNFQSMTKLQGNDKSYLPIVIEAVKFELSKDNYTSAFEWMRNRARFLGTESVPRASTPSDSGQSRRSQKLKKPSNPYPATDERLIDFINVNLQVHVNRAIERAKDEVPQMKDETRLDKFFFKLASEFLRRNKGWHNENSFTNPQHLVKLEESTGLRSSPSETSLTFSILREVIDSFRCAYKIRYPKTLSN